MRDFRLIETMRVSESGEVFLLERHLERLRNSSRYFSFKYDSNRVRDAIVEAAPRRAACLRLLLSEDGALDLQTQPLPGGHAGQLMLSTVRVNSKDPFLYHKTTNRGISEQARQECDENTDAILINERGEITETTITNLAVFRDDHWITPALSCGLLPGVLRAEMLARGEIIEGIIPAEDLHSGEVIRSFNALRGIMDVRFRSLPRSGERM